MLSDLDMDIPLVEDFEALLEVSFIALSRDYNPATLQLKGNY